MARPTNPGTAQPEPDAELSAAARAVVHDAGDPRIDAHLAALGLGADPSPTRVTRAAAADAELQALRKRIATLELEQTALITRGNVLAALLAFAILVVVALVALLLL
jgi:hypothetical protein